MYPYFYLLLFACMNGLGLGEKDVKCKAVGFRCDDSKKKVEFCRRIDAEPELVEKCEGDQVCKQEDNNVRCIDPRNVDVKFVCTGRGEFPDTQNCSRTYICSGEGEEPSEVCTCPNGTFVYPVPGLFCMPGRCPRKNITCTEGVHGYFTLTNNQKTSYYYYCLNSDTVLVYENVEVPSEEYIEKFVSRLRTMENNGKECIPHIRGSSTPTTTESTTPGSSTSTTTESTTPGSSTSTTTQSTTPGSSTPTTTESTTPGSSTPTTTESTTPGSSTPTTTQSTTPGSSTPTTTESTTPGSSTPTTTESTTPGSSTPTTTQSTTPGSSTPTTTESTTPGSSTPTTTESTTPGSSTPTTTESTTPGSSTPTTPTSTSVPPEEKPTCKSKGELHKTECDCDYYKCDSDLKPNRRTCKDGLKYHAKLKRCVFGECDESKCIHRAPKFVF